MYLPPLQPVANSDIRICGDVDIHPTASIASGVILQAAPNSKIIIGVDVCIGMGVIITACEGVIEIANGATLGSGVLIFGHSKIGSHACIGTASTVFNASVDSMKVITPGSIIGDVSRSQTIEPIEEETAPKAHNKTVEPEKGKTKPNINKNTSNPLKNKAHSNNGQPNKIGNNYFLSKNQILNNQNQIPEEKTLNKENDTEELSDPWLEKDLTSIKIQKAADKVIEETEKSIEISNSKAIGKIYIDQLLVTLFPHKKHLNNGSNPQ